MKLAGTCNKVCPLSTRIINNIHMYVKTRRESVARCFNETKTTRWWRPTRNRNDNKLTKCQRQQLSGEQLRAVGTFTGLSCQIYPTSHSHTVIQLHACYKSAVFLWVWLWHIWVCVCRVVWERIRESTCWADRSVTYSESAYLFHQCIAVCVWERCLIESNRSSF